MFRSRKAYLAIAISLVSAMSLFPVAAYASIFSGLSAQSAQADTLTPDLSNAVSSQDLSVVSASNIGPGTLLGSVSGGNDSAVVSGDALTPAMGPVGNASDAADLDTAQAGITFYTVRPGDTVGSVAQIFNVDQKTILSANSLKKGQALTPGTTLVILPMSGLQITVKKGDTVKKLASAYKVDPSDIYFYNNLTPDDGLTIGDTLILPNATDTIGDAPTKTAPAKKKPVNPVYKSGGPVAVTADGFFTTNKNGTNNTPITVHPAHLTSKVDLSDELVLPVDPSVGRLSQAIHPTNAVDIAAPLGTPIHAIADGTILLARTGGYNGGYGNYVILLSNIDGNPVESIYGHQSKLNVVVGQRVSAGDVIGFVGRTGDATGNHLHVEVRGAKNPFVSEYRRQ